MQGLGFIMYGQIAVKCDYEDLKHSAFGLRVYRIVLGNFVSGPWVSQFGVYSSNC